MFTDKQRRVIETVKTVLIVVLSCSVLLLAGRTQFMTGLTGGARVGVMDNFFAFLRGGAEELLKPGQQTGKPLLANTVYPLRIALTIGSDTVGVQRLGLQYSAATASTFEAVGGVMAEALSAAKEPVPVDEDSWHRALRSTGIYCDFLGQIPLNILSRWLAGEENQLLPEDCVRRVCVATAGEKTRLYYINENDGLYYACDLTVDLSARLMVAAGSQGPNRAFFAFEANETFDRLDPGVMILPESPKLGLYAATNPLGALSADELSAPLTQVLRALSFTAQANSVYQSTEGIVVQESTDTLRVSADGVVTYRVPADGTSRYALPDGSDLTQSMDLTRALAEGTVGALCGDGRLYLSKVEQQDGRTVIVYDYSLEGAAVALYSERHAAQFELVGTEIESITLTFRSYGATGETSLLLPELQATAVVAALGESGGELLLRYEDGGAERISPVWSVGQAIAREE